MLPPLVSVLIPAWNAERWLGETLRSVLAQTWPNLEVVIADDGSSDATLTLARGHASARLRVLALPHRGAAATRNAAIAAARGEYLQFLDADDLIAPDKVAAQMAHLALFPRRVATGPWAPFIRRPGDLAARPDALWADLAPVDWLLHKFNHNAYMFPATWLAHRELVARAGPWNEALSLDDDGEFMVRLVAASDGVAFVPGAWSHHRVGNAASLSSQMSAAALRSLSTSMHAGCSTLLALEDSARTRGACVRYLQDNVGHFIPDEPALQAQLHALARRLGGHLTAPPQSRHFELMCALVGWRHARRLRARWNALRWRVRHARARANALRHDTKGPAC